jgi:hypothetical protein
LLLKLFLYSFSLPSNLPDENVPSTSSPRPNTPSSQSDRLPTFFTSRPHNPFSFPSSENMLSTHTYTPNFAGGMSAISLLAVPALLTTPPPPRHHSPFTTASTAPTTTTTAAAAAAAAAATPAQQFRTMYAIGRLTQPPGTLATALSFFYLAYHAHSTGSTTNTTTPAAAGVGLCAWRLWAYGGAAVLGALWPFTFLLLEPVSQRLLVLAAEGEEEQEEEEGGAEKECRKDEAQALLRRWGVLNMVRAVLPAVGAGCGFWAVFSTGR